MNESVTHVAIDPGANGCVILRWSDGSIDCEKMGKTIPKIGESILQGGQIQPDAKVFIEKVGYHMPGNAVGSSVKFGRHVGELRGLVYGLLWHECIGEVPSKWMKHFGKLPKGTKNKKARKEKLKSIAQKLFPKIKVTLWNADGLLMMKYMLDKEQEQEEQVKKNA